MKTDTSGSPVDSSGDRPTLWLDPVYQPHFDALTEDLSADICVIGGGITGLTAAYLALKAGRSVVLLEDGRIGSGETGRTTGHLSDALDDRFMELEKLHGAEGARLAAESHRAAIDFIEKTARDEAIDCDFERVPGYLFLGAEDDVDTLKRERDAALRAGLTGVTLQDRLAIGDTDLGPALCFPDQAQFHAMKYLAGLCRAALKRGARIFDRSHVERVIDGDPCVVETTRGAKVTARAVIVATNSPISDGVYIHLKQASYRSYVVGAEVPKGSFPRGLYWDTADPYHYLRVHPGDGASLVDTVIIGGEDHKTGQAPKDDPFENLFAWARRLHPAIKTTDYRWSGQIMEPNDGLGYLGRNAGQKNVYIATGDSGNGLTHGTIAGLLIVDLIVKGSHPWQALYDPARKPKSLTEYAGENLNAVKQYGDWVHYKGIKEVDDLAPGEGVVINEGLTKVAVCRDDDGAIRACSAVCTHLGAVVRWNAEEKTWDCPAHGSRFDTFGQVLNGPATANLSPAPAPDAVLDKK